MKILLVHNYYRSGAPGGEDVVFRQERRLLEAAGVRVVAYTRSNDEVDDGNPFAAARTAMGLRWSRRSFRELSELIRRERPDVAHFHNTFPLISASGYAACRVYGVPVVQTLHNYRTVCAAAIFYRDGAVCELCKPGAHWPAVRHRCYRGSTAASLLVASSLWRNWKSGVYLNLVDRFVVLTRFAATRLAAAGVPPDRIVIKPNFVEIASSEARMPGDYAVFAGRLSPEKGLRTLLDAWRELADVPLKILGDGPLMAELAERCRRESLNVQLLGMLPRDQVLATVAGAQLQVVPSECFEGLPMAAVEAFGCGIPVVAARIGSLEEMIVPDENGLFFEAGNGRDLAKQVRRLRSDAPLRTRIGRGARDRYLAMYTPQRSLEALLGLYGRLTEESAGRSMHANGQHAGATSS